MIGITVSISGKIVFILKQGPTIYQSAVFCIRQWLAWFYACQNAPMQSWWLAATQKVHCCTAEKTDIKHLINMLYNFTVIGRLLDLIWQGGSGVMGWSNALSLLTSMLLGGCEWYSAGIGRFRLASGACCCSRLDAVGPCLQVKPGDACWLYGIARRGCR